MPSPTEPTIYDRIAAHSVAVARHEASCHAADPTSIIGRALSGVEAIAAATEYKTASNLETTALYDLLGHVPSNAVEMRRQIGYLRFFLECRDGLDRDQINVLFDALMNFRLKREDA